MSNDLKIRYSDQELDEFKNLISEKLLKSEDELIYTRRQLEDLNSNGFNQQGGDIYDDSSAHSDFEMLQRMVSRQAKYIQDLRNALLRIQNKTYGVCIVTGQLIDKQRLKAVPHATKTVDGKNMANVSRVVVATPNGSGTDSLGLPLLDNTNGPHIKPVSSKVRFNNISGKPNSEEWDGFDNEQIENASYARKSEEDDN